MESRRVLVTGGSGFIGTHFVRLLEQHGVEWANLDLQVPVSGEYVSRWIETDLREAAATRDAVLGFDPTHVVHLAARTDTDSDAMDDYTSNTLGTLNLLLACRRLTNLQRFVLTSTQFVLRSGVQQGSDLHFDPHTTYGVTKVTNELMVRSSLDPSDWVIVRPTNIWGPWHPRYGKEFWRVLDRGLYVHPAGRQTVRTYGYVRTVAHQLWHATVLASDDVAGRTFYLGDPPIELAAWVDGFSRALRGSDARRVPRGLLRAGALAGDAAQLIGIRSPLTTSRFRSMTEDYITPVDETIATLGPGPVSLEEAIAESVAWYRTHGRA